MEKKKINEIKTWFSEKSKIDKPLADLSRKKVADGPTQALQNRAHGWPLLSPEHQAAPHTQTETWTKPTILSHFP